MLIDYKIPPFLELPLTYFSNIYLNINPYWRSDVIMVGVATSATGTIISLIQANTFIALISFVATCILSFAFYYVEAYIHIANMKTQITQLQKENASFSSNNVTLQKDIKKLESQITFLETVNQELAGNSEKLNVAITTVTNVMTQIRDAQAHLTQLNTQIQTQTAIYAALNQESKDLQKQVEDHAHRLKNLADRFSIYAHSLDGTTTTSLTFLETLLSGIQEFNKLMQTAQFTISHASNITSTTHA